MVRRARRKPGALDREGKGAAMRFEDRCVVITGAGAGIGQVYAESFAREGASIVIADLDAAVGEQAATAIRQAGGQAISVQVDVGADEDVTGMAVAAEKEFGGIDILINNAGIHLSAGNVPLQDPDLVKWRRLLDVNVTAALAGAGACRASMERRGGGVIINQSSMAAYNPSGSYGISKLALNALTVALSAQLAPDNIRVNGIAPGLVDSAAAMRGMTSEAQARVMEGQSIKRLGRMTDLASTVLFLCSEEASFITGQTFVVDGGHTRRT